MHIQTVVVAPSSKCPFYVEALRYVPSHSYEDGFTIILMHALNLHKETFDSFLNELLENPRNSKLKVREAWVVENPNHGQSSLRNQELLSNEKYKDYWSASEYARAVHSFMSATSHGVDFQKRRLFGLAHSAGSTSMMLVVEIKPTFHFEALAFLDPAVLAPRKRTSDVLNKAFEDWAKSKKDTWPSREVAYKELSKHPAYRRWDPKLVRSFVTYGLRPIGHTGAVTLCCKKAQEAGYFIKAKDITNPPADSLIRLCEARKTPVHLIIAYDDELRGKTTDTKIFQVELVARTGNGSVQFIKGGHMLPQVAPAESARSVVDAMLEWKRRADYFQTKEEVSRL